MTIHIERHGGGDQLLDPACPHVESIANRDLLRVLFRRLRSTLDRDYSRPVFAIAARGISIREAAVRFGVPASTLNRRYRQALRVARKLLPCLTLALLIPTTTRGPEPGTSSPLADSCSGQETAATVGDLAPDRSESSQPSVSVEAEVVLPEPRRLLLVAGRPLQIR